MPLEWHRHDGSWLSAAHWSRHMDGRFAIRKRTFASVNLNGRFGSSLFSNSGIDVKLSVMFLSGSLFSPR